MALVVLTVENYLLAGEHGVELLNLLDLGLVVSVGNGCLG